MINEKNVMPSSSPSHSRSWFNDIRHLFHDIGRLLWSWWTVDRIRVSSREGELLRLPIGTLLQVDGTWWTVKSRWICDHTQGLFVRYQCDHGSESATLEVHAPVPTGSGQIGWITTTGARDLHPAEIEVYEITT